MQHILAIDIGTTHCKAMIIDVNGGIVNLWQTPCITVSKLAGQHEQDPDEMFNNVAGLMQKAFATAEASSLACVSFSCAMHGIMAVDKTGAPLTNLITWADTRSAAFASELLKSEIALEIYRQTGTPVHAMSPLCKLLWLRSEHSVIFNKAHKFISFKEYLFYRLFGKFIVDHSIASATGLFNIHQKKWNESSLRIAGISVDQLCTPVHVTHSEESLTPESRVLLGLNNVVPFVLGGGDGCLANIGCGAIHSNELALTIGTSGAIRIVTQKPYASALNTVFNYLITDSLYVVGGPTNNGGNVLQWFVEQVLQKKADSRNFDEVLNLAEKVAPSANGLLFLPYVYGERAPIWNATARGCFIGLSAAHAIEHMARAVVEGICFGLYDIFCSMTALQEGVDVIYATGGFTKSSFWLQMIADVFGKKVVLNNVADASSIGAAMIGMVSTGILESVEEGKKLVKEGDVFLPDIEKHEIYARVYKVYQNLYGKLQPEMEALNSIE